MSIRAEIESLLVFLLEDSNLFVQEQVQLRFMELGDRAVPLLDQIRVQTKDKEEKTSEGGVTSTHVRYPKRRFC